MQTDNLRKIVIKNATENNLKSVDVEIPHNTLTVVTGVSGSGKSSLVYDIINNEAQRRFFEFFSSRARQFTGKMKRPDVEHIEGLSPVISVGQKTVVRNPRSTVGTMSELNDYLRLILARFGKTDLKDLKLEKSLFSFNSEKGACPVCKGLGVEDKILPELLISDSTKSIREGALVITTPTGYTVYSQVTIDVMNDVCNSEGFNVDIPWNELTEYQKDVILYGSEKIKIPYGKHTLESRMKWSGITAKPREEGVYKGIVPVMEVILKRDRNKNILRFVRSVECSSCNGSRYNEKALSVEFMGKNIADFGIMTINELENFFSADAFNKTAPLGFSNIKEEIIKRTNSLNKLGLEYLTLNRESTGLTIGESQRIRLSTQINSNLRGITYILDEPSVGLHPEDNKNLLAMLKKLRDNGNTVIVVEHDKETMLNSDYIIDIGPYAGKKGGEILFSGYTSDFLSAEIKNSQTIKHLTGEKQILKPFGIKKETGESIKIFQAKKNNLKNINVKFNLGEFNVVTGVSGAGKSSLIYGVLLSNFNNKNKNENLHCERIEGLENIDKIIKVDRSPIGKTSRSNPATYTKLFDYIRELFASLEESKKNGWNKGRFSFNVKGGRCEKCEGAGEIRIGMHFLGDVGIICDKCKGKRFKRETLQVKYKGKNIYDVLEMQIDEAYIFFDNKPKIKNFLQTMLNLGLGYLSLGQSSLTLSGGESQRIKLAAELSKKSTGKTLYILDEPTTGLHFYDIEILLKSLFGLVEKGNTIIAVEHNTDFIKTADRVIDLGPGSGELGGELVFSGNPTEIVKCTSSLTGRALIQDNSGKKLNVEKKTDKNELLTAPISIKGVATHNLKNIDIEIPINKMTVITGVSGSGKSSLAFDTLFAESYERYTESFSTYVRSIIGKKNHSDIEHVSGLMPSIAISRKTSIRNPRSTVGTVTEIYDYYRLLFSRGGISKTGEIVKDFTASMFSFNHEQGACSECKGLGEIIVCDPDMIITNKELPITKGAMSGTKTGKFYGDEYGRYIAILNSVAEHKNIDFSVPWEELNEKTKEIAMYGTGDEIYNVIWKYKRKNNEGEYEFNEKWQGFIFYVNEEYQRKHDDRRGDSMLKHMKNVKCNKCNGGRLKENSFKITFSGLNISELSNLCIDESIVFFEKLNKNNKQNDKSLLITENIKKEILHRLYKLKESGLGYLQISRNVSTLSGGETQRMHLAALSGAGLIGICYVVDEPTCGLHSRDTKKLLNVLKDLCYQGNTVVIVEHDEDIIRSADYIIDLGEGAGTNGGNVIAKGTFNEILNNSESKTGRYLKEISKTKDFSKTRNLIPGITINEAYINNLKGISLNIPKGGIVAVTGVSGSGKSSLIIDVLAESVKKGRAVGCKSLSGTDLFSDIIVVNQKQAASSSLSSILTFAGIFDIVRELFSKTDIAIEKGFKKSMFSLNNKGGRCDKCNGTGKTIIKMDFLQDIKIVCEECGGKRYNDEILKVLYKEKSIYDVLEMTIEEMKTLYSENKNIHKRLELLCEVGLSYIKSGQTTDTLSGGEIQRLKLAIELMKSKGKNNLYIFDEPTNGLHFEDVEILQKLFNKLVDSGNSIIVIEHNKEIIRNSDFVIDLGKEGGIQGGEIIAQCTPVELTKTNNSYTGQMLKD